jgi:hypothetical protein
MTMAPIYKLIANAVVARRNCAASGNLKFLARWDAQLDRIEEQHLPSGSGIDGGTKIDREDSNENKILLRTSFHHMNEHGGYNGWTNHLIVIEASLLSEFHVKRVSGRNRNDIKDYLAEVFDAALREEADGDLLCGVAA